MNDSAFAGGSATNEVSAGWWPCDAPTVSATVRPSACCAEVYAGCSPAAPRHCPQRAAGAGRSPPTAGSIWPRSSSVSRRGGSGPDTAHGLASRQRRPAGGRRRRAREARRRRCSMRFRAVDRRRPADAVAGDDHDAHAGSGGQNRTRPGRRARRTPRSRRRHRQLGRPRPGVDTRRTGWGALGGAPPTAAGWARADDDARARPAPGPSRRARARRLADVLQLVMACGGARRQWVVRQARPAPARLGGSVADGWVAREHPGPGPASTSRAASRFPTVRPRAPGARHVDEWVETLPARCEHESPRFRRSRPRSPSASTAPTHGRRRRCCRGAPRRRPGWRLEDLHASSTRRSGGR